MPLLSLPGECLSEIFFFLDVDTLYNCLFVSRYWCRCSVPLLWKDPFRNNSFKIVNTLLACLNEDEISSLIPCSINFNNQTPLFEYGKFIKKINHENCAENITTWLNTFDKRQDCRIKKLVNVIYHMIMRQGSDLEEFNLKLFQGIDLPRFSIFTTYNPGISNFKSLVFDNTHYQNIIEFLSMVPKLCNGIINCEIWSPDSTLIKISLDIIKSQPLLKKVLFVKCRIDENIKNALEFRKETLKELLFHYINFQETDLSFISKFERLERLIFHEYDGFPFKSFETLSKRKFQLKELKLLHGDGRYYKFSHFTRSVKLNIMVMEALINSFCSEVLLRLSLNFVSPEIVQAVKESCPNISFLRIKFYSGQSLNQIIPLICELSTLKILNIEAVADADEDLIIRIFSDHLTSVECLKISFGFDLPTFEYFTNNCKANLNKLVINLYSNRFREDYLRCVNNYQMVHNFLKVFGVNKFNWTNEELEIISSLKDQGINIVLYDKSDELKFLFR